MTVFSLFEDRSRQLVHGLPFRSGSFHMIQGISIFIFLFVMIGMVAGDEDSGPKKSVMDQAGRRVNVPVEIHRVVTAYRPATMIVYALGGQKKVSTISSFPGAFPLLEKINPEYQAHSDLGSKRSGLNLEAVLATKPDLVILYPTKEGRDTAARLEQLGMPAIIVDPESIPKLFKAVSLIGRVLGLEVEAGKLLQRLHTYLDLVRTRTDGIPRDQRKRVYFASPRGVLTTSSTTMMQHSMVDLAGGVDVVQQASGGWIIISPEQLHVWNPEAIFLSRTCPVSPRELMEDKRFQAISAVKMKRVFRFPANLNPWDYPGCENLLAVLWMSICLYPERYADLDFRQTVNEFYASTYGKTFDELGGQLD